MQRIPFVRRIQEIYLKKPSKFHPIKAVGMDRHYHSALTGKKAQSTYRLFYPNA